MKTIIILLITFFLSHTIQSQSIGDYKSVVNNGNWDDHLTWDVWDGSQWLLSSDYPGQSSGTGNVTISDGISVNVNTTPANSIGSLVMEQGSTSTYLLINLGGSLTVTGAITIQGPNGGGACNKYVTVYTGGQLTAGSITMLSPTGGTYPQCALDIEGGTVNMNGNITMNYTGIWQHNVISMLGSGPSTLNMNSGTITGGEFINSLGTIAFNNPIAQTIAAYPYRNLIINSGGTTLANAVNLSNDISISGNLTVTANHALNLNGHTFTLNGNNAIATLNGNLYVEATGAALLATGTGSSMVINSQAQLHLLASASTMPTFSSYTIDPVDSYVMYEAPDAQVVYTGVDYGVLRLDGAGTKTATSNFHTYDLDIFGNATLFSNISGTGNINIERNLSFQLNGVLDGGDDNINMMGSINDGSISIPALGSRNFYNLVINKGNSKKTILSGGNINVNGMLSLTSGLFSIGTNTITLTNVLDANQLTGGDASSYIFATGAGRFVRNLQNVSTRKFPVGTATNYLPVSIWSVDAAGNYGVNVFEGATTNGTNAGSPFTDKSMIVDAIWNIDRLSGSGQATLRLYWQPGLEGAAFGSYNDNQIGISHYNGSSWDNAISTSTSNTSDFSEASFSSFSPFGIGFIGAPLPVKFGPVKAYEKQQGIQVDWKVYSEENISTYAVERSANGSSFSSIGSVASRNGSSAVDYGFFDASPLAGISFYRIRSVSKEGKSGLSSIVRMNLDKLTTGITLYPNPVINGILNLQTANLAKGTYTLHIFNSSGLQVMLQSFKHEGGALTLQPQFNNRMPAGIYSMDIELNGVKIESKKFTVQ